MKNQEKIDLIRQLTECLAGISFMDVENTADGLMRFINYHFDNLLLESKKPENFMKLFRTVEPGGVYEIVSRNQAHFLVLQPEKSENYIVIGPCLTEKFTEDRLYSILQTASYLISIKELVKKYYEKLPVLSETRLMQFGELIGCTVFEDDYQGYQKITESNTAKIADFEMEEDFENLYSIRKIQSRYEMSAAFLDAVAKGNRTLALQFYRPLLDEIGQTQRSRSQLRNAQNYCVIMNSQLRQAVSRNGINPFLLDQISGKFAVRIEEIRHYENLVSLGAEMIETYCGIAGEQRNTGKSLLIRNAIMLIQENLSTVFSVKKLAEKLNVNADYLSNQFSKELECTLTEYVNMERVHQAAELLKDTEMPVWRVAGCVGYNNVSYFSKQFQKYYQMSPSAYRKN